MAQPSRSMHGTGGTCGALGAVLNPMEPAHMDDFKSTGPQASLTWLLAILRKSCGGDVKLEQDKSRLY